VRFSLIAGIVAAIFGLVALTSLAFGWSFQRAAVLAPVIVACAGGIAGLVVLWTKAALAGVSKPSDGPRSVLEPDGLENSTLPSRAGARAREGDRP
jgi:hypothetical protein